MTELEQKTSNTPGSEWASIRRASLASYLTGFYIAAHFLELAQRFPILESIRFHFLLGAVVAVVTIPKLLKNRFKDARSCSLVLNSWLLIAIFGIYTLATMDPVTSRWIFSDRVIKLAMMAMFIYASTETVDDLRVIIGLTLLAWLKIGQEGFIGWITGSMMWDNQGIPRLHGSTPWFGHPNSFSGFGVGCLPFCVLLLGGVASRWVKAALLGLLCCALVIIVTTGSRTGYVATLVGAIIYLGTMRKGLWKKLILAGAGIAVILMAVPRDYVDRFESTFTMEEKEGRSAETRMQIIRDAIEVVKVHPLGVGIGAFPKVRYDMFRRYQDTHNLYLELLTNTSIFGLLAFLWLVKRIIGINLQNARQLQRIKANDAKENLERRFMLAIARAAAAYVTLRLALGLFGMDAYEIYWWFALGLTLAVNKLLLQLDSGKPSKPRSEPHSLSAERGVER